MYAQFSVPLFTTWRHNNNLFIRYSYETIIRYSSYTSACVNTNNCSVDLYNGDHQTTTVFLTRNSPSHKADWILTTGCLLYPAIFIDLNKQSDEYSWSRMFMLSLSLQIYWDFIVDCAFAYLSIRFFLMPVVMFGLLGTCSMYLCRVYLYRVLNDITSFLFA